METRKKEQWEQAHFVSSTVYSTWYSYLEIVYDDSHYKTVGWCHHDLQENYFFIQSVKWEYTKRNIYFIRETNSDDKNEKQRE